MTNKKQDTKYHEVLKQASIYSYHKAENIGNLSKRVQKTPKEIKETAQRIHPNSLQIKDIISGKIIQNYESRRNSNLQEFKHAKQQTPCVLR